MTFVLDASALIASLQDEPGRVRVDQIIDGAMMTSANLAEVADQYSVLGQSRAEIVALLGTLPVRIVEVDYELAIDAAMLKPLTRVAGLSLGDRLCLALAVRLGATAVTTNRIWARVADAIGVDIELIR